MSSEAIAPPTQPKPKNKMTITSQSLTIALDQARAVKVAALRAYHAARDESIVAARARAARNYADLAARASASDAADRAYAAILAVAVAHDAAVAIAYKAAVAT